MTKRPVRLSEGELHELKRWNTPTIYNGWEQITRANAARDGFNLEPIRDYMPLMGPMAGYAITVVCEPGNSKHKKNAAAWSDYAATSLLWRVRKSWWCTHATPHRIGQERAV